MNLREGTVKSNIGPGGRIAQLESALRDILTLMDISRPVDADALTAAVRRGWVVLQPEPMGDYADSIDVAPPCDGRETDSTPRRGGSAGPRKPGNRGNPGARDPVIDGLLGRDDDVDEREMLIQKVADLEHLITESDKTVAWVNRARPVIIELMAAYERRIRSLCSTPEELAHEPWRCGEYVAAERLLAEQPTWVVTLPPGLTDQAEVKHG